VEYRAKTDCFKHSGNVSTFLKHSQIRDYLHERPVHVVKEMKGASFSKPREA